jgi:hypothetical protein
MQRSVRDVDLDLLNVTIAKLQQSSRRTLPMFAIGILAAIFAGGFAVYYVFRLWTDLDRTSAQLQHSQEAVIQGRLALAAAKAALNQSHAAASHANAPRIASAIRDVSTSERKLSSVAQSLAKATVALPSQGSSEVASSVPTSFDKPQGKFIKTGQVWIETPAYAPGQYFTFNEIKHDTDYVYLVDPSRLAPGTNNDPMVIRLPLRGGSAQWSYQSSNNWKNFTNVQPADQ